MQSRYAGCLLQPMGAACCLQPRLAGCLRLNLSLPVACCSPGTAKPGAVAPASRLGQGPGASRPWGPGQPPYGAVSFIHACLGAYLFLLSCACLPILPPVLAASLSCETLGVGVMRALLETLLCRRRLLTPVVAATHAGRPGAAHRRLRWLRLWTPALPGRCPCTDCQRT